MNQATLLKLIVSILVTAHLAGNVWHGEAHTILDVALPAYKTVFVVVVILLAPLIGAALTWFRYAAAGYLTVAGAMLCSVTFSVYHHFVWISNDNVEHLPPGNPADHAHFANSAELIALLALVGAAVAFYAAGTYRATSTTSSFQP